MINLIKMSSIGLLCLFVIVCHTQTDNIDEDVLTKRIPGMDCTFYYSESKRQDFHFHYCLEQQQKIDSWPTCIKQCCSGLQPGSAPSSAALRTCIDNGQEYSTRTVITALIALGSIIFICVLCCICVVFFKFYRNHHQIHDESHHQFHYESHQVSRVEWAEETQIMEDIGQLRWSSRAKKDQKLKNTDITCCICLQQNPNAELFCHHLFHAKCIGAWLLKNNCCPFCRHNNIKGVKVYCKGCLWKYMVFSKSFITSPEGRRVRQMCLGCEEARQRKESEDMIIEDSKVVIDFDKSHELMHHEE